MTRIPILYLITDLSIGGAQTALLRTLTYLDQERFAPSVACLYGGDSAIAQQIQSLNIPVTDLQMTHKWRGDALWRLYNLLQHKHPVILHTWMFHANISGKIIGRLVKIPIIITSRRNVNIGGAFRETIKHWTSGIGDKTIAVCELARQSEIKYSRTPPEKVVVIYNGIEPIQTAPTSMHTRSRIRHIFNIPTNAPLLGFVGRLHPQKGIDNLLTALVYIRQHTPDIRLLLIGDGKLRTKLETQVCKLNLSENVIFTGIRTDIPAILKALDIFILPSLWEGFPNAILEAMNAGLPVVTTNVGGIPEVVSDEVTGLLVPPQSPNILAKTVIRLLDKPHLRHQIGQAGQKWVNQQFNIATTVRHTEELYQQLLDQKLGINLE